LGAMHMGASALKAVEIACKIDPYSAPPIIKMVLSNAKRKATALPKVPKGNDKGISDTGGQATMALCSSRSDLLLLNNVAGVSHDKPKG
jgi:hypothetical protein